MGRTKANALEAVSSAYVRALRGVVRALGVVAGLGVLAMMGVTCVDVILRLRWINRPLLGANDIVQIASAVTLAAALPYTTAVKGHVAIEYFFHKLNRTGRIAVDTLLRLMAIALFACLSWRCVLYGQDLRANGQVSMTLELPIFWVPHFIALCCGVVVLVILYNLVHPGREMIKP